MVLIRTALTMNISRKDAKQTAFLVNGTHLGLLSASQQKIHVQTSHRPLQLAAAFSEHTPPEEFSGSASPTPETVHALPLQDRSVQKQMLVAWQAFATLLSKRGSGELANLLQQYHLQPRWLLCLDEKRLQAWLPVQSSLYRLRQGELFKMTPIQPRDPEKSSHFTTALDYYSISLQVNDYLLMLPPDLLSFFEEGEIADILCGLQQLPVKMSEIMNTARLRGMTADETWLAWQIAHMEADQKLIDDRSVFQRMGAGLSAYARNGFKRRQPIQEPDESGTESLAGKAAAMVAGKKQALRSGGQIEADLKPYQFWLIIGVPVVILLIILMVIILPLGSGGATDETTTTQAVTTTTAAPTATPIPTPTPEPTPEPEPDYLIVTANRLNMREAPGSDQTLLTTLDRDDLLIQLAEPEDDWVQVRTEDGLEGYVFYGYVEIVEVEVDDNAD